MSDKPRRLAGDASYDLAFPRSFTNSRARAQNDVLMNLNASARLNARALKMNEARSSCAAKETAAAVFSRKARVWRSYDGDGGRDTRREFHRRTSWRAGSRH